MIYKHIKPTGLRQAMRLAEWEQIDQFTECRGVYIGSVMDLAPSGKYYTPFAHSNVEICDKCAERMSGDCGDPNCTGGCCEAHADAIFWEEIEAEVDNLGYSLTSGEGDPTDVIAVECRAIQR